MNDETRYTAEGITDTTERELPNVSGDADPFDAEKVKEVAVFVTNNGDQPLTARLERATFFDAEMTEAVVDVGGVPVPAGETVAIAADPTVPMAEFRTVVAFDTAPTNGSVVVEYQVGERWR